eukprot:TRINITY_DN356_c0_g2_i1.p1 TRINITY_DN356_c0_g2~~TRINITY_DN356_c0_g2_i1.p1  ORF type:complete len:141 (+),score=35.96 TRINITY_DN356_c0_g2_i1:113-535(+)
MSGGWNLITQAEFDGIFQHGTNQYCAKIPHYGDEHANFCGGHKTENFSVNGEGIEVYNRVVYYFYCDHNYDFVRLSGFSDNGAQRHTMVKSKGKWFTQPDGRSAELKGPAELKNNAGLYRQEPFDEFFTLDSSMQRFPRT